MIPDFTNEIRNITQYKIYYIHTYLLYLLTYSVEQSPS